MFYKSELALLCSALEKNHIHTEILDTDGNTGGAHEGERASLLCFIERNLPKLEAETVYKLTTEDELSYRIFLLPNTEPKQIFCIGPFLDSALTEQRLLEIGEKKGVSPKNQRYISEYYSALAVASDDNSIWSILSAFCERVWGGKVYFTSKTEKAPELTESLITSSMLETGIEDTLMNMKAMEMRYEVENEIIRAVELGNLSIETKLRSLFSSDFLEMRMLDPVRNAKNYCIIMNTLLRKAAEKGGVHPMYIDRVSSDFALRIERLSYVADTATLMCDIFRAYCLLVRKHSMSKYSTLVKRVLAVIDNDPSQNLSPRVLAENQGVSLGYLSSLFKKETKMTLSEYTRRRRMKYAYHLLSTTNLQIQTVALHCGIMDVQYFSKLFRREYGMSPSELRRSAEG